MMKVSSSTNGTTDSSSGRYNNSSSSSNSSPSRTTLVVASPISPSSISISSSIRYNSNSNNKCGNNKKNVVTSIVVVMIVITIMCMYYNSFTQLEYYRTYLVKQQQPSTNIASSSITTTTTLSQQPPSPVPVDTTTTTTTTSITTNTGMQQQKFIEESTGNNNTTESNSPVMINDTDDDTNIESRSSSREKEKILSLQSCHWIANVTDQRNQPCYDTLIHHMKSSLQQSRQRYLSSLQQQAVPFHHYVNRRYVILGDSTVYRLYAYTHLRALLMDQSIKLYKAQRATLSLTKCNNNNNNPSSTNTAIQCRRIVADRCSRMEQIRLIPIPNVTTSTSSQQQQHQRRQPNFTLAEGPMSFGIEHHACTDCRGCETKLISCSIHTNKATTKKKSTGSSSSSSTTNGDDSCTTDMYLQEIQKNKQQLYIGPAYGGFLSVEFAKDVELQTVQYSTTQENIVHTLLGNEFNTPANVLEFGRPICIVNTGQHDIAIPNVTRPAFVTNVVWYLQLLSQQCDYIIFISNNCPLTDQYIQTKALVYEWNMAVRDHLLQVNNNDSTTTDTEKIFFLDIFNASITYEHLDNIHMAKSWYVALATFLSTIMNTNFGIYQ